MTASVFERLRCAEPLLLAGSDRHGDEGPRFLENVPHVMLIKDELANASSRSSTRVFRAGGRVADGYTQSTMG